VNLNEYLGGTVAKIAPRTWQVTAPDGKIVGTYHTKSRAIEKAQYWDKWDALDSLANICATRIPFTTALTLKTMVSLGTREECFPTEGEMEAAITLDVLLLYLGMALAEMKRGEAVMNINPEKEKQ